MISPASLSRSKVYLNVSLDESVSILTLITTRSEIPKDDADEKIAIPYQFWHDSILSVQFDTLV